jgi:2-iminoacetate synthase
MGRTGEHFMEFSVPGFIKRYCTPNAMLTLAEYLGLCPAETARKGWQVIEKNLDNLDEKMRHSVTEKLDSVRKGERDLHY